MFNGDAAMPRNIKSHSSTHSDLMMAVDEITKPILDADENPSLVLFSVTVGYDVPKFYRLIKDKMGDIPFQGGTSCGGVLTQEGYTSADGRAMASFAMWDEDSDFGLSLIEKTADSKADGINAVEQAIDDAGRTGELPSAIWLIPSPGGEEGILEGIKEEIGGDIPLIGGSSADNTIEGNWYQFSNDNITQNGIAMVAIFRDDHLLTASFHSGYDISEHKGVVTNISSERVIEHIDGRPAAEVYNEWTRGAIDNELKNGGHILSASNLFPIGRLVGDIAGVDYYQLSHPETVTASKGLSLFTNIEEGQEIICMQGTIENLTARAGNVVKACLERDDIKPEEIEGALIIFCAGCMMTVGDQIDKACKNIKSALGEDTPFWGMFTFGEQGSLAGGENCHGNLMIAACVFTNREI
jgi:hypothetical protein